MHPQASATQRPNNWPGTAPKSSCTDATPEVTEDFGASTIMARGAQPGEIASVIAFLALPKASYITGAVIAADGGRTAI